MTATGTPSTTPKLGVAVNEALLTPDPAARRRILDHIAGAGLDHVTTGDHISFQGGTGLTELRFGWPGYPVCIAGVWFAKGLAQDCLTFVVRQAGKFELGLGRLSGAGVGLHQRLQLFTGMGEEGRALVGFFTVLFTQPLQIRYSDTRPFVGPMTSPLMTALP